MSDRTSLTNRQKARLIELALSVQKRNIQGDDPGITWQGDQILQGISDAEALACLEEWLAVVRQAQRHEAGCREFFTEPGATIQ